MIDASNNRPLVGTEVANENRSDEESHFAPKSSSPQLAKPTYATEMDDDDCNEEAPAWPSSLVDKLYGREEQERELFGAFARIKEAATKDEAKEKIREAAELCLITGRSGTGKTRLAHSLRPIVERDGGFFVSAKFDQLQSPTRPFATLNDAFQELVQCIGRLPQDEMQAIQESALKAVGSEACFLAESFPCLREFLHIKAHKTCTEDDEPPSMNSDTEKRLAIVFRRFVRAMVSQERPLCLFLDDLQWACPSSLNLLRSAFQKNPREECPSKAGFLILGTCRGNEVDYKAPLSVLLRELEDGGSTITDIRIGNLSQESLCELLADCLRVQHTLKLRELGELIYQATNGNVMFALQYLKSLHADGLLQRDDNGHWTWNTEEMSDKCSVEMPALEESTSSSLTSLLESKLRRLSNSTQEVLKLASCLGAEFDLTILRMATNLTVAQLEKALVEAAALGCTTYDMNAGLGRFTHDKFLEASYALIPEESKASFHYQIAKHCADQMTPEQFSSNLLLIVNHAINGSATIESNDCRCRLAGLCLDAGQRTAKSSEFTSAARYFEAGIKELQEDAWKGDQYQLSLHLHNAAAEVAYCVGDHQKAEAMVDAIQENARRFEDKVQAYNTQMMCLTSLDSRDEARSLGIEVTNKLGETFPTKTGMLGLLMDFLRTKRALKRKTSSQILNMPPMTDTRALGLMRTLHQLYAVLLRSEVSLAPFVGFKMVRITLRHGLSPLSCIGFGFYASVLSRMGIFSEAVKYGQLALTLMEQYRQSGVSADTLCTVWGDSMPHSISYRECLQPIEEAYSLGMAKGSTSTAMIAGFVRCALSFCVGEPLAGVEGMALHHLRKSHEYGQPMMIEMLEVIAQGCCNLRGLSSNNPLILTGSVMEEEVTIERASKEDIRVGFLWVHMMKYSLAVFLHEFEEAEKLTPKIRKHMEVVVLPFLGTVHTFYEGLVAAVLSERSRKHRSVARAKLKQLRAAAKSNPESLKNKVCLLEAEMARCSGDIDKAVSLYERSIAIAAKERYLHEEALACERAGRMFLASKQPERAKRFLSKSRELYAKWDAKVKVEQIDRLLGSTEVDGSKQFCSFIGGKPSSSPLSSCSSHSPIPASAYSNET